MGGVFGAVVDALFPLRCLGCGHGPGPFCDACTAAMVALVPPGCVRCGRPHDRQVERCADCPPEPIAWSRSAYLYAGPARSALMRLKFSGWRSAAGALGPFLAGTAVEAPFPCREPVVTWVPLGRRRRRTRGFDQAEVLARALGRETGWPVAHLLARVKETAPQARRGARERREALWEAFAAAAPAPLPQDVVLVDDVLTTGATAAACAAALVRAGAGRVGVLTFARALAGLDVREPLVGPSTTGRST